VFLTGVYALHNRNDVPLVTTYLQLHPQQNFAGVVALRFVVAGFVVPAMNVVVVVGVGVVIPAMAFLAVRAPAVTAEVAVVVVAIRAEGISARIAAVPVFGYPAEVVAAAAAVTEVFLAVVTTRVSGLHQIRRFAPTVPAGMDLRFRWHFSHSCLSRAPVLAHKDSHP